MWVSEEHGIPLRIETNEQEGQSVIEYKNLKVGSIPDVQLELPPDVEIADMRTPK